ncbi:MAG: hypothetical protein ABIV06_05105, partial [Thermoanaerobaculia bacterium]
MAALTTAGFFTVAVVVAQGSAQSLAPRAIEQLRLLGEWKDGRTPTERKIDSQLLFAVDRLFGRTASVLARIEVPALPSDGRLELDIALTTNADAETVAGQVRALGGEVSFASSRFRSLRATIDVAMLRPLAANAGVRRLAPALPAFTHGVVSEGDRAHAADLVRNRYGYDG